MSTDDRCTTISDVLALSQVMEKITALKTVLGAAITWGPLGTFAGPGSCDASSNNRWRGP